MKTKLSIFLSLIVFAAACSFSTASLSSFKTSKDKDGKTEATTFKAGETLYANAIISGSMSKTTTKMYLHDEKNTLVPGTEVKVDLASSGTAQYNLPLPAGVKGGKYTVFAEMLDEKGEKKDTKSVAITIEAAPAPPPSANKDEDSDDSASDDAKDDKK
ncbi:MAG: hypothetical protein ABL959_23175 [Pyrinomonadaceae bacterium]